MYLCSRKSSSAGGMAYMVEHLPSKLKALISNPSTIKKKNQYRFYEEKSHFENL
jgi:hypothetical protein